jgi:hypothetical protein
MGHRSNRQSEIGNGKSAMVYKFGTAALSRRSGVTFGGSGVKSSPGFMN